MKKHIKLNNSQLVSIIIPVKNGERFLRQALDSMIAQTYKNWEMIIVDDASEDQTPRILKEYALKKPKIKIITLKKSIGISKALNKGISHAKGSIIARMDADDISYLQRLEKQVAYLEKHPQIIAVGSQCNIIDSDGNVTGIKTFPKTHEHIYETIFHFNPLQHPVLMVNRAPLPKKFIFYDILDGAEDVNLLFKLFPYGKIANMDEILLAYRIHANNSSLKKIKQIYRQALLARINGVTKYGYKPSITSVILTIAQTVLVTILPERLLRRLYFYARGIKANISKAKKIILVPNLG